MTIARENARSWAVVLAGGVGSRFWPLSTPARPKQLLPLVTEQPMLRDTLDRLGPIVPIERTLVLTNASLVEPIRALAPAMPAENVIAEPRPAGTSAALAWAASEIARRDGPDAVMMSVHADWSIGDPAGFREALVRAGELALAERALVTVGIVPSRPDPGFGYIRTGEPLGRDGAYRVSRFVEKPDRVAAERMVADGYLWNSGIFVWCVGDFLDELRAHTPEVWPALSEADGDIARFFAHARNVAVDVGVLERSARVLVIPGNFEWDDVGTWSALGRVRRLDHADNALNGDVIAHEASRNVAHAEPGCTVILYGVDDLVVVSRDGLTLVTTRERSVDLKSLIESLPADARDRS